MESVCYAYVMICKRSVLQYKVIYSEIESDNITTNKRNIIQYHILTRMAIQLYMNYNIYRQFQMEQLEHEQFQHQVLLTQRPINIRDKVNETAYLSKGKHQILVMTLE